MKKSYQLSNEELFDDLYTPRQDELSALETEQMTRLLDELNFRDLIDYI